jgi:hypothetical protein
MHTHVLIHMHMHSVQRVCMQCSYTKDGVRRPLLLAL